MTTRISENQKEPSGSGAHRAPLPDGFCSAIARGGVPDAPRRRNDPPVVGGGVPDAPCRRIETPYRVVEDADPYGRAAHNAPCQRIEKPYRAVEDAGPYGGVSASPTPRADAPKRPTGRRGRRGWILRRTPSG
ncbi:MAG: hypothetical protein IKS21_04250 [Oscillospiraceae bacterium]|nr:hypothetical protein [Oscillospiraceae bacterium]